MKLKKLLSVLLTLAMVLSLSAMAVPVSAADAVEYLYYDTSAGGFTTGTCSSYTVPNNANTEKAVLEGWFVVKGDITIEHALSIGAKGVHLILTNGSRLTVNGGIHLPKGTSLAIYGQGGEHNTQDDKVGELYTYGDRNMKLHDNRAGIGGFSGSYISIPDVDPYGYYNCGNLTVHGGHILAVGSASSAGIGSTFGGSQSGSVTVYGGYVKAKGGTEGAGIGGGTRINGGSLSVYGGEVWAEGGYEASGIGGGYLGSGGNFTIYDGTVTAYGDCGGAGIGGGYLGGGGTAKIYGAEEITASGSFDDWYTTEYGKSIGSGTRNNSKGSVYIPDTVFVKDDEENVLNDVFDKKSWTDFMNDCKYLTFSVAPCDPFTYRSYQAEDDRFETVTYSGEYRNVTKSSTLWQNGWYVVNSSGEINDGITVKGDVNLVLNDTCTLTANRGIFVGKDSSLTVYAQSDGEDMGSLIAKGPDNTAGLGGGAAGADAGKITIHGGNITATGGKNAAGLGGGANGNGADVRMYGGFLTATGGADQRAIGKGLSGSGNGSLDFRPDYVPLTADGVKITRGFNEWIDVLGGESVSFSLCPAETSGTVSYTMYDTGKNAYTEAFVSDCKIINKTATTWENGWYLLDGNGTIDETVTVTGDVHLILSDGCALTITGGINVSGDNSLTVYAQSRGGNAGSLTSSGKTTQSGIGCAEGESGGSVTVHGGFITANGGTNRASESGSAGIGSANVTVYGGSVTALGGENAAGIGGGTSHSGSTVTISGGSVTAKGGDIYPEGDGEMPAIGGGRNSGSNGTVTVKEDARLIDNTSGAVVSKDELTRNFVSFSVFTAGDVSYLSYNEETGVFESETCASYKIIDQTAGILTDGWYVAVGEPSFENTLKVQGDVHLILADNGIFTANGGINVNSGNSLTVYAQSDGSAKGRLISGGNKNAAGIGGEVTQNCGDITVHGGSISAIGTNGAGIGGGLKGNGGKITIYGGDIVAKGDQNGAGIGGGSDGGAGEITIYGGNVSAEGILFGAGIGGCDNSDGTVTIYGGDITAQGGEYGHAFSGELSIIPYCTVTADGVSITAPNQFESAGSAYGNVHYNCIPAEYSRFDVEANGFQLAECEKNTLIKGDAADWNDGWYVACGEVMQSGDITVTGDVKLILTDGSDFTVNGTVFVEDGNSLTVYAQSSDGESTGRLCAKAIGDNAGIGGKEYPVSYDYSEGKITDYGKTGAIIIHGGNITATGGYNSAGIGGGSGCDGGTVVIYGGNVTATGGKNAEGFGCGYFDLQVSKTETVPEPVTGGSLNLYGGTVYEDGEKLHIHRRTFIPIKDATCTETGSTYAFYVCDGEDGCGKYFDDYMGDVEISTEKAGEYLIPAKGHTYKADGYIDDGIGGHYRICEVCSEDSEHQAHSYETSEYLDNGDGTHGRKCEFCGAPDAPEAHDFESSEYLDNGDGTHGRICGICNGESKHEPHVYEKGICIYCQSAASTVAYAYYDSENAEFSSGECDTFTLVRDGLTSWEDGTWYVADGNATVEGAVTVKGDVYLILKNNCDLEILGGITVDEGNSLTIYEEYGDGEKGTLNVTGADLCAGIGSAYGKNAGNIVIHGGTICAKGGERSAGLGGSADRDILDTKAGSTYGSITVYGGSVEAYGGKNAPGIGGGAYGEGGTIDIFGGDIYAEGNELAPGIGSGMLGALGDVTIYGGKVTAKSNMYGDGIGYYYSMVDIPTPDGSDLTVCGGEVFAESTMEGSRTRGITKYCRIHVPDGATLKDAEGNIIEKTDGQSWNDVFSGLTASFVCEPGDAVPFRSYTAETGGFENKECGSSRPVFSNCPDLHTGWYVLENNGEFNKPLLIVGDVHLILKDGCTLTANGGINVSEDSSLTVYAQKKGTGSLIATGKEGSAGIGGDGKVTIHGGIIKATGGEALSEDEHKGGAGLGGNAESEKGCTVTIYGGDIEARGARGGAGIGSGYFELEYGYDGFGDCVPTRKGTAGNIAIYGGNIEAAGGYASAGIGGGYGCDSGNIVICGGNVTATGGENSGHGAYDRAGGIGSGWFDELDEDEYDIIQSYPVDGGTVTIGDDMAVYDKSGNRVSFNSGMSYVKITEKETDSLTLNITGKSFTAVPSGSDVGTGIVTVALYDSTKSNKLLDVQVFDLAEGDEPKGTFTESGLVRAYWWTGLDTMIPMCKPVAKPYVFVAPTPNPPADPGYEDYGGGGDSGSGDSGGGISDFSGGGESHVNDLPVPGDGKVLSMEYQSQDVCVLEGIYLKSDGTLNTTNTVYASDERLIGAIGEVGAILKNDRSFSKYNCLVVDNQSGIRNEIQISLNDTYRNRTAYIFCCDQYGDLIMVGDKNYVSEKLDSTVFAKDILKVIADPMTTVIIGFGSK